MVLAGAQWSVSSIDIEAAAQTGLGASLPGVFRYTFILLSHAADGLPYAFALMTFFFAHEMGHFVACRYHKVRCTLPYFIPSPPMLFMLGTFGAVIRIRSTIPDRRKLFDIGVAGPLAGFIAALPFLVWGILRSELVDPSPVPIEGLHFGRPLLISILLPLLRDESAGKILLFDPVLVAAWVSLLATAMNLLPAWQLDGGHLVYALSPRWHGRMATLTGIALGCIVVWAGFRGQLSVWVLWALLIAFFGRRHPPLLDSYTPLGAGRRMLFLVAAVILILCFTPHPLSIVG